MSTRPRARARPVTPSAQRGFHHRRENRDDVGNHRRRSLPAVELEQAFRRLDLDQPRSRIDPPADRVDERHQHFLSSTDDEHGHAGAEVDPLDRPDRLAPSDVRTGATDQIVDVERSGTQRAERLDRNPELESPQRLGRVDRVDRRRTPTTQRPSLRRGWPRPSTGSTTPAREHVQRLPRAKAVVGEIRLGRDHT